METTYHITTNTDTLPFAVVQRTIIFGARTSAYESELDKVVDKVIYKGSPADCLAVLQIHRDKMIK